MELKEGLVSVAIGGLAKMKVVEDKARRQLKKEKSLWMMIIMISLEFMFRKCYNG